MRFHLKLNVLSDLSEHLPPQVHGSSQKTNLKSLNLGLSQGDTNSDHQWSVTPWFGPVKVQQNNLKWLHQLGYIDMVWPGTGRNSIHEVSLHTQRSKILAMDHQKSEQYQKKQRKPWSHESRSQCWQPTNYNRKTNSMTQTQSVLWQCLQDTSAVLFDITTCSSVDTAKSWHINA